VHDSPALTTNEPEPRTRNSSTTVGRPSERMALPVVAQSAKAAADRWPESAAGAPNREDVFPLG
jgi:hypothetical protein